MAVEYRCGEFPDDERLRVEIENPTDLGEIGRKSISAYILIPRCKIKTQETCTKECGLYRLAYGSVTTTWRELNQIK